MASVRYRLEEFVSAPPDEILGRLTDLYARMGFSALWTRAIEAWNAQFPVLQQAVVQLVTKRPAAREWHILLEYTIPLRDRRPDVIILATDIIFVIEFKVGAVTHDS